MSTDLSQPRASAAGTTRYQASIDSTIEHCPSAAGNPEHLAAPVDAEAAGEALKHGLRGAFLLSEHSIRTLDRRHFLQRAGVLGGIAATFPALADTYIDLDLPGGPDRRELTTAFPQKAKMIVQRTRPPLLETPWDVYDRSVFTPNNQFFVRWHWAVIPEAVEVGAFKLAVRGHVNQVLSLSLADLLAMPRVELVAVCQCSGNSRGLFQPRVTGAQWQNGAMGNARWTGVRLRDVLDRAGVKAGAVAVRSSGSDNPVVEGAPKFMKPLDIDHARDGEVMLAFQMNGEQLPLLNGFPLRLVVPGWYGDYWVKMLADVEVLDAPDQNYFEKTAYRIPDTPHASVKPGETGFKTVPISRLVPRSFFTNLTDAMIVEPGVVVPVRGIAFGGDCGVLRVELLADNGRSWQPAALGRDEGPYSFRQWSTQIAAPQSGSVTFQVRCTNTKGEAQPAEPNWNGGGFMRNVIEHVHLNVR
jgi:DMSO/TMAO reductase YedYZ molybdopterin-dependent catalytic subunit